MNQKLQGDDIVKGLLALTPLMLSVISPLVGFSTGMIATILILFLVTIIYLLRKLIPPQQKLVFILTISVSWILIVRMILDAEAYSLADKIGLFLPLLLINSLVLSVNESILYMPDFKSVMNTVFSIVIAILLFFVIFGFFRELLNDVSILTAPAGCFLLLGFLFAAFNFLNKKRPGY